MNLDLLTLADPKVFLPLMSKLMRAYDLLTLASKIIIQNLRCSVKVFHANQNNLLMLTKKESIIQTDSL